MLEIMGTRAQRLENCLNSKQNFLITDTFEFCAPLDSQGLYALTKIIHSFLQIDYFFIAYAILYLPILIVFILTFIQKNNLNKIFILNIIVIAILDIFYSRVFILLEWSSAFWLTILVYLTVRNKNAIINYMFLGLILALFEWIRSGNSWGAILLLIFFVYKEKTKSKQLIIFSFSYLILFAISKFYDFQTYELAKISVANGVIQNHTIYHMILIGYGLLENPMGILGWGDEFGYKYIKEKYNIKHTYNYEYDNLAKKEVFSTIINHPIFVIKLLIYKFFKCLLQISIVSFPLLINLLYNLRNFKFNNFKKIIVDYWVLMLICLFMMGPGILINPVRQYIGHSIALFIILLVLILDKKYKLRLKEDI